MKLFRSRARRTPTTTDSNDLFCSFCGNQIDEVKRMIASRDASTCICDECVETSMRIIRDGDASAPVPAAAFERPRAIRTGDRIAVAAPAGAFDPDELRTGIERIGARGYEVVHDEGIFERERYLAGSDERRASELLRWLGDPDLRAVLCARGGYGSARTVDWIYAHHGPDPFGGTPAKPIVGYSDLTYLLLVLGGRTRRVTFHGPQVAVDLGREEDPESLDALLETLSGTRFPGSFQDAPLEELVGGQAEGTLFGGCLSMLVTLPPRLSLLYGTGLILFLEEIGEPAYRVDRMLTQLRAQLPWDRIRGVVIGHLKDVRDPPGGTIRDVLMDRLGDLGVPVAMGLEAGHGRPNRTLPLGVNARLDTHAGTLHILDPVVRTDDTGP